MYDLYAPFIITACTHQNQLMAKMRIDATQNKMRERYIKRYHEQIATNRALQQSHRYNRTKHK